MNWKYLERLMTIPAIIAMPVYLLFCGLTHTPVDSPVHVTLAVLVQAYGILLATAFQTLKQNYPQK